MELYQLCKEVEKVNYDPTATYDDSSCTYPGATSAGGTGTVSGTVATNDDGTIQASGSNIITGFMLPPI